MSENRLPDYLDHIQQAATDARSFVEGMARDDFLADKCTQQAVIMSLTDSIDTGTPSGRFFFHVMASLAEMERELTVERTRAGLAVAKQLGRKGGRKPKMTDSKIESAKKLLASGVPPRDVAKNLGVSIPTLYRWVPASLQI